MKKILMATTLILSTSSLLAASNDTYSFVGLQSSLSNSLPSFGIKYGQQNSAWRTSLSLSHAEDGTETLETFRLQADQGVFEEKFKNSSFKPYIGFSMGILRYKKEVSDKGILYGINTGVTYLLSDNIDVNVEYRFSKTSKMTTLDHLNDLTFSLHYFY